MPSWFPQRKDAQISVIFFSFCVTVEYYLRFRGVILREEPWCEKGRRHWQKSRSNTIRTFVSIKVCLCGDTVSSLILIAVVKEICNCTWMPTSRVLDADWIIGKLWKTLIYVPIWVTRVLLGRNTKYCKFLSRNSVLLSFHLSNITIIRNWIFYMIRNKHVSLKKFVIVATCSYSLQLWNVDELEVIVIFCLCLYNIVFLSLVLVSSFRRVHN